MRRSRTFALEFMPTEVLECIFHQLSTDRHGVRWNDVLAVGRTCSKLCDEVGVSTATLNLVLKLTYFFLPGQSLSLRRHPSRISPLIR